MRMTLVLTARRRALLAAPVRAAAEGASRGPGQGGRHLRGPGEDRGGINAADPDPYPRVPAAARPAPGSRSLTFTEAEFNAYLACRLADENEAYVKAAEFKLLADDRVEGRITIDLGKPQAAGVLPQQQDLLFAAGFETRDGMIRINMDKLFLGTQPISPAFVDIIIGVVSRLQGVEPTTPRGLVRPPARRPEARDAAGPRRRHLLT